MRAAARSAAGGAAPQGLRVESLEPFHRRPLADLVFQGREAAEPRAAIGFRDIPPLPGGRMRGPPRETLREGPPVRLAGLASGGPRLAIAAGSRRPFPPVLRLPEAVAVIDVMPLRRQPPRAVLPRRGPSPVTGTWPGTPARRPAPGLLHRLARGQHPSLHGLRRVCLCWTPPVVRSPPWYYGAVRSGTKIGNAHLKGAFSAAAVLFLQNNPAGQKYLAR
jgi:hypothetical protein